MLKPLNLSDGVVHPLRVDVDTYQGPLHVLRSSTTSSSTPLPLSIWYKRLGHSNFSSLKTYLNHLNIKFNNNSDRYICNSCLRAKATKTYHQDSRKRSSKPYQFVHTDLVGPINHVAFSGEKYFFIFTDNTTRMTETYTGTKKSDWLKCLKIYHSLCRTRSKEDHPIERLRSDYGSELQSHKADEWIQKEGITFEPSAPYSQEQNGVSERTGRTIMDMTRATILEGNIDDDLWPELVLAMTYVKNNRPTRAVQNLSPHEAYTHELPDLSHLRVLGSTVYVFLHEEERTLKSEKWAPRALKGTLVGYDGHTIYRVHLKDQKKVIRVKDLRIFEDYESKFSTELPDYSEGTPTFQGFLLADNDNEQLEDLLLTRVGRKAKDAEIANQSPPPRNKSPKVNDAEPIPSIVTTLTSRGQKVEDAEFCAEDAMKKTRTDRTIKLSVKAKDAKEVPSNLQKTFLLEQNLEIKNLIIQLTNFLGPWHAGCTKSDIPHLAPA